MSKGVDRTELTISHTGSQTFGKDCKALSGHLRSSADHVHDIDKSEHKYQSVCIGDEKSGAILIPIEIGLKSTLQVGDTGGREIE